MRIAAEAGIAPRVHYLNVDARVVLMDFIEDRPLETYPGGHQGLAQAIGAMLRKLQALPPFPGFMDYPDLVDRLGTHVCKTGLFAHGLLDAASQRLIKIRNAYAVHTEKYVSSHNDFLPRNVLFDGKRLWLIDWEQRLPQRPSSLIWPPRSTNSAPSLESEEVLMHAWLGRAPDRPPARDDWCWCGPLRGYFYAGVLFSASASASTCKARTSDLGTYLPLNLSGRSELAA